MTWYSIYSHKFSDSLEINSTRKMNSVVNLKNSYFMIFAQKSFSIIISISQIDHLVFKLISGAKNGLNIVGKMCSFIKVCLGSRHGIAISDCNNNSSLEACHCTIRANTPVLADFLLLISPVSVWSKNDCDEMA